MPPGPTDRKPNVPNRGKLSIDERLQIIRRVTAGETQAAMAHEFGVTPQAVSLLLQRYRELGEDRVINPGTPGRKPSRPLTTSEEEAIHKIIREHKTPHRAGLKLGAEAKNEWGELAVKRLVKRECGFTPTLGHVRGLLEKWGMASAEVAEKKEPQFSQDYYDYINSPIGKEVSRRSREMRERQLAEQAEAKQADRPGGEGELDYSEEELAKIRRKMLAGRATAVRDANPNQRTGKHRKARAQPNKRKKRKKRR